MHNSRILATLACAMAAAACGNPKPAPVAPASEVSVQQREEPPAPKPPATAAQQSAAADGWIGRAVKQIAVDREGMRGCTGGMRPEAPAFYRAIFDKAAPCVERELRGATGLIQFHSTLEAGDGLSEFSVTTDSIGQPALVKCFQDAVFEVEYPKIAADVPCVQFHVPVELP